MERTKKLEKTLANLTPEGRILWTLERAKQLAPSITRQEQLDISAELSQLYYMGMNDAIDEFQAMLAKKFGVKKFSDIDQLKQ